MDSNVGESSGQAQEAEPGRGRAIAGLILSLVGCFMVVLSFYLIGAVFQSIGIYYLWVGLTLAVAIVAVVLSARGLHAPMVHCMAVISVVLGAFAIMGALLVGVPVLWAGA